MISEIAVSHTSSYMVRGPRFLSCTTPTHIGTVVCGNYSLRCFSLYSCFLSSVLKRAANHRPQNRCIIKNYRPLCTNVTVSTCNNNNNNNGYLIEDERFGSFNKRQPRRSVYLIKSASAPPVRIYVYLISRTVYLIKSAPPVRIRRTVFLRRGER